MRIIQKLLFTVASLLAFGLSTQSSFAQEADTYPVINRIVPEFSGFRAVSDQYIFGNIQLRPGMNYNPALLDQSIRTLYSTGYFEFVEVRVDKAENETIDVVFELVSKYTIERIRFLGNDSYSDSRLASKAEVESGQPLDEYQVSVGADAIAEYYVEKGFPDVEVDYRIQRDEQTGYAVVNYDIDEGGKVRIAEINFEGNTTFSDKKLRSQLETAEHNWLSWLLGSGKFDEKKFKEDLDILRKFYRDAGFLDSVIEDDKVDISFVEADEIVITIPVVEGQLYFLGDFTVENATVYTSSELLGATRLVSGAPFSPQNVDDAATAIREYYTSNGYLDTSVRAERVPNMETREIDVVFRIRESEKFYVESIKVEGNTKSKARVIVRELALSPGDVFDRTRMEVSQRRLQNTSFFEDVRLNPEPTNVPGRKDLGVTVREGRTGNFTFGAGFGSVESAVIYFEISQGNFDLFNWRSGFQGDGQKFRFRASLGTSSNQIVIAFEEPWLFEQRLAFGVEIYRTESDYNSADYNELRTGFELYLRRRLFELVEARLSYRLELVEIFDVDRDPTATGAVDNGDGSITGDGIADVFQRAEGEDIVSKVGLTFLRDTRETLVFTRKGNRSTLSVEYAGLGGDVNYYKFEGRTAHFIPTFDTLQQSLSIVGRMGSVTPFGQSEIVPFYDRFYLGGPDTLRGFDYREVGPRDPDDSSESVGGNSYSMVSFEYGFRIAEPLGLVVFYDWGFVNENDFDFSMSNYADNWGVGARIMLMGSPLKLDLGIPITSPDGAAGGTQFNFSFGTRF
ncbi:outer membrane protein assembly factor BamA [Coraliomargarita sp. SDUM461004]|uniref:Outer membrane protein assembly factor BamA n=1 Tax=Thalassobacterium sedimentorum TaxID=3041258 RepID=A0ABU1AFZ9_9BACT|nr:outer membrane protein assembly factor BamA [Coraliomargarita sp. SDUM461004]MDQ8193726.1 outer membrane protein assembly factor BamA [Coraliomargarita sp. SDUM461004]